MAFQFPSNPQLNQPYTDPITKIQFKWNGKEWVLMNSLPTATVEDIVEGKADYLFITPKKLMFGFQAKVGVNGFMKFPIWLGGFIIQWGEINIDYNQTVTNVPLNIPFPTGMLYGSANVIRTTPPVGQISPYLNNFSTTTFKIFGDFTGTPTLKQQTKWLAIGY